MAIQSATRPADERRFSVQTIIVYNTQEIRVDTRCNSWTVRNIGDTPFRVNDIRLLPFPPGFPNLSGESYSIGGNKNELYGGKIQIQFELLPGVTPAAEITQKFYIE